jgi:hypothetical protein
MPNEAELLARQLQSASVLVLMMDRGNDEHARTAAIAANDAIAVNPDLKLIFAVEGCDEDVREVDEIEDARETLARFMSRLDPQAFWRFEVEQQAIMLTAAGLGRRYGTQLHVPPWLIKKTWQFPKEGRMQ